MIDLPYVELLQRTTTRLVDEEPTLPKNFRVKNTEQTPAAKLTAHKRHVRLRSASEVHADGQYRLHTL
jgi:hypothetical protein